MFITFNMKKSYLNLYCIPAEYCGPFRFQSVFAASNFGITIINEHEGTRKNEDYILIRSLSSMKVTDSDNIFISGFIRGDDKPAAIEIQSMSFSLDQRATVTCSFIDILDDLVEVCASVSIYATV